MLGGLSLNESLDCFAYEIINSILKELFLYTGASEQNKQ